MIIYVATNLIAYNNPIIIIIQNNPVISKNKHFQLKFAIFINILIIFLLLNFIAQYKHSANDKHKIIQSIPKYFNTSKKK